MFQSAGRITIPGNCGQGYTVLTARRFNPPGGSRYLGTSGAPWLVVIEVGVSIRRADHDTWELDTHASIRHHSMRFQSAGRITIPGNVGVVDADALAHVRFQSAGRITIPGNFTYMRSIIHDTAMFQSAGRITIPGNLRGARSPSDMFQSAGRITIPGNLSPSKWWGQKHQKFQSAGRITIPGNFYMRELGAFRLAFQSAGRITIPGNCWTIFFNAPYWSLFQSAGRITIPGNWMFPALR